MIGTQIRERFASTLVEQYKKIRQEFDTSDACLGFLLAKAQEQANETNGHTTDGLQVLLDLLDLSEQERAFVTDTLAQSVIPWQSHFKTALLAKMRAANTSYKPRTLAEVDLTNPQDRWHVRGATTARCRQVFDQVVTANKAATSPAGKRYITRNLISDLVGCSPTIAIRFCEANAEEIAQHNEAIGFTSAKQGQLHNQWVYKK